MNDAPVAASDSYTMNEDTSLSISTASLLANDSDVDGDTLSIIGVSSATNGSVSLSGSNITFTPNANFYGNASFQYTVSDGQGGTTNATVNITVNDVAEPVIPPMPDPPGYWHGDDAGSYWYIYPGYYQWNGSSWVYIYTPVAVDLDGDGLELVSLAESTAAYDIDGDGEKELTGWVAADDGLLAYDHNQDGQINRLDEISFVGYLPGAKTDLEGLRAFDSNQDGMFSAEDAEWSKFGIWQDANQDGVSGDGEYKSLDEVGITAISLTSDENLRADEGNIVFGESVYHKADGTTGIVGDVGFAYEPGEQPQDNPTQENPSALSDIEAQMVLLKAMMASFVPSAEQQAEGAQIAADQETANLASMAEEQEKMLVVGG